MDQERDVLLSEVRYAERLSQRTARLYRHVSALATFLTVAGASGTATALASSVPAWVSITGAAVLTMFGALKLAVRPDEKAVAAEADQHRYARLRADALDMDAPALRAALEKARETDTPEIESLREVAYNDTVCEIGREDYARPLTLQQRLLAALA